MRSAAREFKFTLQTVAQDIKALVELQTVVPANEIQQFINTSGDLIQGAKQAVANKLDGAFPLLDLPLLIFFVCIEVS